jgi:hypothetical protein
MNLHTKILTLLLVVSATSAAYAQDVPLTAKIHETEQVFIDGKLVRTHTREGIFLRTSSGMVLRQWTLIDGKQPTGEPGYGVVTDTQKGLIYNVDYARQTAYLRTSISVQRPTQSQKSAHNSAPNAQDKGFFEGLSCRYNPTYVHTKSGETINGGRTCRSDTYGIDLSAEVTLPAPANPAQYSKITELMTDIQIGTEPDSKPFDFRGFTIYKPEDKNQNN